MNMGNTEGLPSVGLLCARTLVITGDGWGDGFGRKGSWMTTSVVSECKNGFPNKDPSENSPAAFLRTFDVISLVADDNHDDRHTPVTFCHEFVRRLPLDRQG